MPSPAFPASHSAQIVSEVDKQVDEMREPTTQVPHDEQNDCPVLVWKVPSGHGEHASVAPALKYPTAHASTAVLASSETS